MITAIIFIIVGLLMILSEFFLPGAIMGAVGAIFVVVGLILFAVTSSSFWLTVVVYIATIAGGILLVRYALKRIRNTKQDSSIYLKTDQEGYRATSYSEELVGQEGEVLANLKPSGHILINGQRYQAVSRMGYLEKGTKITVIGGEGGHLVVKKTSHQETGHQEN